MMLDSSRDVRFVSAKRTGFGAFGGAFKDLRATDRGTHAAQAAPAQSGFRRDEIDEVFFGDVVPLPREKTNVDGCAIAIGHPLAASGARIVTHLLYELHRRKSRHGVGAACIGGGRGVAVIVESLL